MNNDIKVGSLVWVAYPTPCCGNTGRLGAIFTVSAIRADGFGCVYCKLPHPGSVIAYGLPPMPLGIRLSRLKLIPPLPELDRQIQKEDSHEPA